MVLWFFFRFIDYIFDRTKRLVEHILLSQFFSDAFSKNHTHTTYTKHKTQNHMNTQIQKYQLHSTKLREIL